MKVLMILLTILVAVAVLLVVIVGYKMAKKVQNINQLKAQLKKKRLEAESEKSKPFKGDTPAAMGGGAVASLEEDSRFRPNL